MAANAGAIRAGRAFVELFADDTKMVRGLRAARARLLAFGESVKHLGQKILFGGLALATPLLGAVHTFMHVGDELDKMSRRTGVGVQALREFGIAAHLGGTELESVETGIKRMQKAITGLATGSKEQAESFRRLGLEWRDLAGLAPEDQFRLIAERAMRIGDATLRAGVILKIFGRGGTALIPMIESLAEARAAMKELHLEISPQETAQAAKLTDAYFLLKEVLRTIAFKVGAAFGAELLDLAKKMAKAASAAIDWVVQNRGLVLSFGKMVALTVAAGGAMIGLGIGIKSVGFLFGWVAKAVVLFGGGLKIALSVASLFYKVMAFSVGRALAIAGALIVKMWAAIVGGATSAGTAILSALGPLFTPIGLLGLALVALAGYMIYASGVIGQAIDGMKQLFRDLYGDALLAFEGIRDALAAGDIAAAAKVLWALLKLEWARGIGYINGLWLSSATFFLNTYTAAVFSLERVFLSGFFAIQRAWVNTIDFMSKVATVFGKWWLTNIVAPMVKGPAEVIYRLANDARAHEARKLAERQELKRNPNATPEEVQKAGQKAADAVLDQAARDADKSVDEFFDKVKLNMDERRREVEANSKKNLEQIDKEEAGVDEASRAAQRRAEDAHTAAQAAAEAANKKDLDEARKGLDKAVEDAKAARKHFNDQAIDRAKGKFPGLPDLDFDKLKTSVSGTFSPAAIRGLGTGGPEERTAKATEETVKVLKKGFKQAGVGFA